MSYRLPSWRDNKQPGEIGKVIRICEDGVILEIKTNQRGIIPREYLDMNDLDISMFDVGESFKVFPAIIKRKGGRKQQENQGGLSVFYLRYRSKSGTVYVSSKVDEISISKQIDSIFEKYPRESFVDAVLEKVCIYKDDQSLNLAILCCICGMKTCLKYLAEEEDDICLDDFLNLFSESLSLVYSKHGSDKLTDYCLSIVNTIEASESHYPENLFIKVLIMTTLDTAAQHAMNVKAFDAVIAFYEYQKEKLLTYSEIIDDIDFRLASIEKKMIMPYVLSGQLEEAKRVAKEAYVLFEDLCKNTPEEYVADYVEVCANLGGIYMDMDELVSAKKVFCQGEELLSSLQKKQEGDTNFSTAETVLSQNIHSLEEKKRECQEKEQLDLSR